MTTTNRWCNRAAILLRAAMISGLASPPLCAGPGEAAQGRRNPPAARSDLARADYVVVVWFRKDNPIGTFEYEFYNVRAGEYTPAVDEWLGMMREKFTRYEVHVRPVDLSREQGATDKLKVGAVIRRELLVAAARSGVVVGAPMRIGPGPYASEQPASRLNPTMSMPGAGGASNLNLPGFTTPFPVPYPRPHP